jgi:hypothetical protein
MECALREAHRGIVRQDLSIHDKILAPVKKGAKMAGGKWARAD